jgi:hypothetical protein
VTTSRVPALIDYLVTTFTAATTLGAATPAVLVFDGPPTTGDPAPLALHVGMDDAFSGNPPVSASSEQTRQGLGLGRREETVTVHCAAVAWAGTDGMKTVRLAAFAILAAVEDLVRGELSHFGGAGDLATPGVSGIVLTQDNTAQGAIAQVAFSITFKAFIGV